MACQHLLMVIDLETAFLQPLEAHLAGLDRDGEKAEHDGAQHEDQQCDTPVPGPGHRFPSRKLK